MIKAVLIDIDNTLLDFDAYVQQAMRDGFEKFGLGRYEDSMYQVFWQINTEMWRGIEQGNLTYEELMASRWNRIFAELGISFDGVIFENYFKDALFESAIPVSGAMDALTRLEGNYILCVASNGPYEQQLNRLKKAGMLPFFSNLFISEKIGFSKPSEEFFSYCLNEINAERRQNGKNEILPSEVIMIGDSLESDMAGAINMGFKTCFFDKNKSGDAKGLPVDYIVDKPEDIRLFL